MASHGLRTLGQRSGLLRPAAENATVPPQSHLTAPVLPVPPRSPAALALPSRARCTAGRGYAGRFSEGDGTQREGLVTYTVRVAWPNRLYAAWSGALDLEDGAWGPPRGCVRHRVAALQCDSGELRHVDNWRMRQRRPHSRSCPWRAEGRPTAGRAAGCPARSARWGALAAQTVG